MMRKVWSAMWSDYREYLTGQIGYEEFRENSICRLVTGDFCWKSAEHERLFRWFFPRECLY